MLSSVCVSHLGPVREELKEEFLPQRHLPIEDLFTHQVPGL